MCSLLYRANQDFRTPDVKTMALLGASAVLHLLSAEALRVPATACAELLWAGFLKRAGVPFLSYSPSRPFQRPL